VATFTQGSSGTSVLYGANTYTGATMVNAGTLQIGNGSSGSINNASAVSVSGGATLAFDEANNSNQSNAITDGGTVAGIEGAGITNTLSGNIGGGGAFTQSGAGTTILSGANSYAGVTTVSAGTLSLTGSLSDTSGVTTSGTGVFSETGAGAISGGATFTQGSSGTSVLGGTNTYTGATMVSAGTLSLTGSLSATSGVTTSGSGVFSETGAGSIGGAATFTQGSSGTSVLGGTNTYTGATTVSAGTLSLTGALNDTSGVTTSGTGVFSETGAGSIGGAATFAQGSSGTSVLSNANTYSGGTAISAGTLLVGNSGALGTGLVTQSGGNLGTSGAGGIQINMPAGYTQNGGTLTLQLNATADPVTGLNAANDLVNVTGAAVLNGTLALKFNFVPVKGDMFTVVETTAGITPNPPAAGFVTPIVSPAGYQVTGSIIDSGDDLSVDVISTQLQLPTVPGISLTPNQTAIALYLGNPNLAATNPALNNAFVSILGSPQAVEDALEQMNPEKFANFARSTIFNNVVFSTQLLDSYLESGRTPNGDFAAGNGQINSSALTVVDPNMDPGLAGISSQLLAWSPAPIGHGMLSDSADPVLAGIDTKEMKPMTASEAVHDFNVFVAGNVVLAQNFSETDLAHSDTTTGAVQIGADYRLTPHLRVGALFGYTHTDADLDDNGSKATVDSYAPGAFISYAQDGWYANAIGSYGFNNFTEDRHMSIGGTSAVAHGAPNGDQIMADLDGGYDFHVNKWTFGPVAGVQYTHLDVNSFSEDGAEALGANESVNKQETDSLRSRLGAHVSYVFQTGKVLLTPHFDAAWQHEFMDQGQGINAQIVNVVGAPFTVVTPNPSRDSALIDCGLNANLNGEVCIFGDYIVQAGQSNYFGQSVQAGIKLGF
jgi:autotransporter-associated beta strand protein